jgi:hypothetical protein
LKPISFVSFIAANHSRAGDLAAPDIDDKAAIVMVETLPVSASFSVSPGSISADQVPDPA